LIRGLVGGMPARILTFDVDCPAFYVQVPWYHRPMARVQMFILTFTTVIEDGLQCLLF